MASVPILIAHASSRFSLTQAQRAADIEAVLARQPHVVGFTEFGQDDDFATAKATCEAAGYFFGGDRSSEPAVAFRGDTTEFTFGTTFVHEGRGHNAPGVGAFQPRRVAWARGKLQGNDDLDLTHHAFHSVTNAVDPGGVMRALMANAVSSLVTQAGTEPRRLATASGDTNEGDVPGQSRPQAKIFADAGLVSVWDVLGEYPDTHWKDARHHGSPSPIDWVLKREAERRLTFLDVEVEDQAGSDHHRIFVHAEVRLHKPKPHACPEVLADGTTCGFVHLPPA